MLSDAGYCNQDTVTIGVKDSGQCCNIKLKIIIIIYYYHYYF